MKTAMQIFLEGMNGYETNKEMTIIDRMERAEKFIEILRQRSYLLLKAEKQQIMEVVEFCDAHCDEGHFDKEGAIVNIKRNFNL